MFGGGALPITQLLRNQHPSPQPPHALRAALEELGSRLGAPSAVGQAMREAWRRGLCLLAGDSQDVLCCQSSAAAPFGCPAYG